MKDKFNHSPEYSAYLETLSSQFFLDILENSFIEVTVTDKNGNVLYANPACLEYHGIPAEKMWKLNFLTSFQGFWTPPSAATAIQKKHTIISRQRSLLTDEEHITITTPLYDDENNLTMLVYNTLKRQSFVEFDLDYLNPVSEVIEDVNKKEKRKDRSERDKASNNIVGRSYILYATLHKLKKASKSDIPILLLGESGVGKSLVAKFIHDCSPRKSNPFISINCASIPDNLIESELFGYVPYAFTGASPKGKKGLVEMANNGTLFLDEIGELQPNIQVKLLDFLENKRFTSVGGLESKTVNTRIITATNKNLAQRVAENKFREDLYWRINGITQTIPSLRERRDDIFPIAQYYLKNYNEQYAQNKTFSTQVIESLIQYDWPGNVRQLKNAVEQMAVMSLGSVIGMDKLPEQLIAFLNDQNMKKRKVVFDDLVETYKRTIIENYYETYENVNEIAEALGLSQTTAYRLINKYIKK
ncbi:sigma-54 interaction domain-containing protein [Acetobacterium bakii]|uniref:HTH-type transcriptional regulatory protein TyrR n=1 Tax=Acetobacterium bakii TaxID=52689 RepID=A0A0L6U0R1_9FIRM|nr:sigma 54-interacting transcriptional regulator [Acetobacterium bakii]KNZ41922.1 Fis family transcriptional regulator [Acetobacterium bakii]